ncbi:hypothetical protein CIK64_15275 [Brevibacterium aurantiacum]|uniref:Uncharacterized protein n=1 Tax=Brevibacterium aurantiacum TaxID=273384 RepID=A0A2A3Z1U1_BREAU|nr:hypothetical protein CIK64_15275 [Brevibacterium aurantiacum]
MGYPELVFKVKNESFRIRIEHQLDHIFILKSHPLARVTFLLLSSLKWQFLLSIVGLGKLRSMFRHFHSSCYEIRAVFSPRHPQFVSASLNYCVDRGTKTKSNGFLRAIRDFFSSSHTSTIARGGYF